MWKHTHTVYHNVKPIALCIVLLMVTRTLNPNVTHNYKYPVYNLIHYIWQLIYLLIIQYYAFYIDSFNLVTIRTPHILPSFVCPDRESEGVLGVEAVDIFIATDVLVTVLVTCIATDMLVTVRVECADVSSCPASAVCNIVVAVVLVSAYLTVVLVIGLFVEEGNSVDIVIAMGWCDDCGDVCLVTMVSNVFSVVEANLFFGVDTVVNCVTIDLCLDLLGGSRDVGVPDVVGIDVVDLNLGISAVVVTGWINSTLWYRAIDEVKTHNCVRLHILKRSRDFLLYNKKETPVPIFYFLNNTHILHKHTFKRCCKQLKSYLESIDTWTSLIITDLCLSRFPSTYCVLVPRITCSVSVVYPTTTRDGAFVPGAPMTPSTVIWNNVLLCYRYSNILNT